MPICFRSSTLAYTPVSLWLPDAKSDQYKTLVERIKQFGPHGVGAVLWHQGESDSLAGTTAEEYRYHLTQVVRSVPKDVGYDVDWFVAEASFVSAGASKEQQDRVAAGQTLLWESKIVFPGPNTDDLLGNEYRFDGVHFTVKGLRTHAQRWLEAIACQYGKTSAATQPAFGVERFEGRYFCGQGDVEYLQLLDISKRMFEPDPEFQNLSMFYQPPAWNGFVEGPTWGAWWIQNSYGPTYCSCPCWRSRM